MTIARRGSPRRADALRAVVAGTGELLVSAGLLVALFLVWQLWWTDVVADRQERQILRGLEADWSPAASGVAPEQHGAPPALAAPADGEVFATLHVPAFDADTVPVAEGIGLEEVLNVKGAGHYPGTAMPGGVGNFAVAGHRTTYGKPFHDIDRLRAGDPVVVETAEAYFVYVVTGHEIVRPTDVQVIAPVPDAPGDEPTERMLTMTACHPLFSARERYVVHARLDYWTERADGLPAALSGGEGG